MNRWVVIALILAAIGIGGALYRKGMREAPVIHRGAPPTETPSPNQTD